MGIDDVAPVTVAAHKSLDKDLRGGHISGDGDGVSVAKPFYFVDLNLIGGVVGIHKIEDKIDLVVSDAGADLLAASLRAGKAQGYWQTGGFGNELARGLSRAEGMSCKDAAVRNAELDHELLFAVMGHKR